MKHCYHYQNQTHSAKTTLAKHTIFFSSYNLFTTNITDTITTNIDAKEYGLSLGVVIVEVVINNYIFNKTQTLLD